jgi:hypothetical protein
MFGTCALALICADDATLSYSGPMACVARTTPGKPRLHLAPVLQQFLSCTDGRTARRPADCDEKAP